MRRNSYLRKTKQIKRKEIIFELDEWAKIEEGANALGITTSDYIRNMTLNGNILHADFSKVAPLMNAMRTISNNINQIARKANETNSIYKDDVLMLREENATVCRSLNQFLSTLPFRKH